MIGVRIAESVQRRSYIAKMKGIKQKCHPIYDWADSDVWKYIADNALEYPEAYEHMYRTGAGLRDMRISQFFSVDTAKSLVKMCEYYPDLFDRICKREPNAYMAMLYFDTEFYRRAKKRGSAKDDETDWKAKCFELLNTPEKFTTKQQKGNMKRYKRLLLTRMDLSSNVYKRVYQALTGGDPKMREYRAIMKIMGAERVCKK